MDLCTATHQVGLHADGHQLFNECGAVSDAPSKMSKCVFAMQLTAWTGTIVTQTTYAASH